MRPATLLSPGMSNAKTAKSERAGKYSTIILYLSPYKTSGKNLCAAASPGCISTCLNTAGRGAMSPTQEARLRRSLYFIEDRAAFLDQVRDEIRRHVRRCKRKGILPAVRLNGTSDMPWESFGLMKEFPDVQFYDYTAIVNRAWAFAGNHPAWPKNYHLTFSRKENNEPEAFAMLSRGASVSVVFRKDIPAEWKGFRVINGDETDLRFLDPRGVIVGLTAKGKAKKDRSGFVVDVA